MRSSGTSPDATSSLRRPAVEPPSVARKACLRLVVLAGMAAIGSLAMGCVQPNAAASVHTATTAPAQRGRIVLLPGVEGRRWQLAHVVKGLRDAGVEHEIEIAEWGQGLIRSLSNLTRYDDNRRHARRVADGIAAYRGQHPDAPIWIVGYSGGGAMAVFVAEALPEEVRVDRIVLVAAAISPKYDLSEALSRAHRGIVSFHSKGDWFILGVGTGIFGTVDRSHGKAAGLAGFEDPNGDPRVEKGLTQVPWRRAWTRLGHLGGHVGWLSRRWTREVLATYLDIEPTPPRRPLQPAATTRPSER